MQNVTIRNVRTILKKGRMGLKKRKRKKKQHLSSLPAFTTERFHREPPQVKMTARINSRPHSFTPYVGSSIGWTPETSRHAASTAAFHIMLNGCGDQNKRTFSALRNTKLYV